MKALPCLFASLLCLLSHLPFYAHADILSDLVDVLDSEGVELVPIASDGYRVCSCSVTCPGGGTLTCSTTSDNCQAGYIGGKAENGCYSGAVGDTAVQRSSCAKGNVVSTTLKKKLAHEVNPEPSDFN